MRGVHVALTRAMTALGYGARLARPRRPILDKHSTGGVGDKVSLILARSSPPAAASCR
jgi:thymidine phosphorylase